MQVEFGSQIAALSGCRLISARLVREAGRRVCLTYPSIRRSDTAPFHVFTCDSSLPFPSPVKRFAIISAYCCLYVLAWLEHAHPAPRSRNARDCGASWASSRGLTRMLSWPRRRCAHNIPYRGLRIFVPWRSRKLWPIVIVVKGAVSRGNCDVVWCRRG